MKRNRVGTAGITSMGYDAQLAVLEIEFRIDGQVWQYYGVPEDIWYALRSTTFKDSFYYEYISGKYSERLMYAKKSKKDN